MSGYKSAHPIGCRLRARKNIFPYSLYSRSPPRSSGTSQISANAASISVNSTNTLSTTDDLKIPYLCSAEESLEVVNYDDSLVNETQATKLSILIGSEKLLSYSLDCNQLYSKDVPHKDELSSDVCSVDKVIKREERPNRKVSNDRAITVLEANKEMTFTQPKVLLTDSNMSSKQPSPSVSPPTTSCATESATVCATTLKQQLLHLESTSSNISSGEESIASSTEITFKRRSSDPDVSFRLEHDSSSDMSVASTVFHPHISGSSPPPIEQLPETVAGNDNNSFHICSETCSASSKNSSNSHFHGAIIDVDSDLSFNTSTQKTFAPVLTDVYSLPHLPPLVSDDADFSRKWRRAASLDARVKTMLLLEKQKFKNQTKQKHNKIEWFQSCFVGDSETLEEVKTSIDDNKQLVDMTNTSGSSKSGAKSATANTSVAATGSKRNYRATFGPKSRSGAQSSQCNNSSTSGFKAEADISDSYFDHYTLSDLKKTFVVSQTKSNSKSIQTKYTLKPQNKQTMSKQKPGSGLRPTKREFGRTSKSDLFFDSAQSTESGFDHCDRCLTVLKYLLVKTSQELLSEYSELAGVCRGDSKLCHECLSRSAKKSAASGLDSGLSPSKKRKSAYMNDFGTSPESKRRKSSVLTGWQFMGEPFNKKLYCRLPDSIYRTVIRSCYHSVINDDVVIRTGDQILVASETRPEPFVAMVSDLYICPVSGTKMARVFWFYGQEILRNTQRILHKRELVASKHCDDIDINCIEDKCFVLTFNQYCRYVCQQKLETVYTWYDPLRPLPTLTMKEDLKDSTDPDVVYWCRKVFDLQRKKILKNPH